MQQVPRPRKGCSAPKYGTRTRTGHAGYTARNDKLGTRCASATSEPCELNLGIALHTFCT